MLATVMTIGVAFDAARDRRAVDERGRRTEADVGRAGEVKVAVLDRRETAREIDLDRALVVHEDEDVQRAGLTVQELALRRAALVVRQDPVAAVRADLVVVVALDVREVGLLERAILVADGVCRGSRRWSRPSPGAACRSRTTAFAVATAGGLNVRAGRRAVGGVAVYGACNELTANDNHIGRLGLSWRGRGPERTEAQNEGDDGRESRDSKCLKQGVPPDGMGGIFLKPTLVTIQSLRFLIGVTAFRRTCPAGLVSSSSAELWRRDGPYPLRHTGLLQPSFPSN